MKLKFRAFLSLATLSAAYASPNYSFPDCVNGPLKSNTVCNAKAAYMDRAQALVAAMTLAELECNVVDSTCGVSRLGLPAYEWWSEALHGLAYSPGVSFGTWGQAFGSASQFPNGISLGAAFDDQLYAGMGQVIANETRAFNNAGRAGLTYYSPINVNAFRDPRWGRGQETPGEDTLLISHYARALVPALQGSDPLHLNIVSTCKHYLAYDMENSDGQTRYGFNAVVTTQDLVEYYLPTFKACIRDAQGASLMTSYNAVNGVPTSTSSLFLETIARERWGFNKYNSFVTSDCDAVGNVFDSHHYTSSYAAAAGQSINAGVDLDCGGTYSTYLGQAISQGITNETTVRKAATRLYATLVRLGYFDPASTQPLRSLGWSAVNTAYAQSLTYRAAWEGVVLLKNNGVLPLSTSKYHTVALIGPWADNSGLGGIYGGPSTFTTTIRQGMTSTFTTVNYQLGSAMSGSSTSGFAAALSAAKSADVVVFCGGIDSTYEAETLDRANITWPTNQLSLINQLAAVGKPMVVVQLGGGQLDDSQLVSNANIGAIVWAGYPGQSGGQAVADILSGKQAPAGRLPVTQYPASYANAVQVIDMNLRPSSSTPGRTYKWYTGTPVFDFGHGLHYTNFSAALAGDAGNSFSVQSIIAAGNSAQLDNSVFATVTAAVKNTGSVTSDYVAALYVSSTNGPTPYPKRALVAYQRLHGIQPGQTATASLPLTLGAMSRIETNGDMNLYPGNYTLTLDNPDQKLGQTTITLTGSRGTVEAWNNGVGTSGPGTTSSTPTSTTSPTTATTTTPTTTSAPAPTGSCAAQYGQCGGETWSGPTCCTSGSTCKYSNDWYSQCL